ncbi:MAG: hypothetical protein M3238_08110, partial [Actinomycetota bacterium]|nr:hypothetical protein [Actinomycetota bacterium]
MTIEERAKGDPADENRPAPTRSNLRSRWLVAVLVIAALASESPGAALKSPFHFVQQKSFRRVPVV